MVNARSSRHAGVNVLAGVSIALVFTCLAATAQENTSPVGTNLSTFPYWATQIPFKNVIQQQAGGWQLNGTGGRMPTMAPDGYPLSWDTTSGWQNPYIWIFLHGPGKYPAGQWVLLYDGQGDIEFGWDAGSAVKTREGRYTFTATPQPGSAMMITIRRTNAANHIRNMRVVEAQYETDFETNPWYPEFLSFYSCFSVLRFMDWMGASTSRDVTGSYTDWGAGYHGMRATTTTTITLDTNASTVNGAYVNMLISGGDGWRLITAYNGATRTATVSPAYATAPTVGNGYSVIDFYNREWADRVKQTDLFQNGPAGISVEWMVDLCNRTNCSPWFCMPTAASDDYMRQFATYVRGHLNPNLRIYLEWSNEAWNWGGYPGWNWSDAYGRLTGVGGFSGYPAYRMTQMFQVWDSVFNEPHLRADRTASRLVRLLSVQGGYVGRAMEVLDFNGSSLNAAYPNPIGTGKKAADYADAMAIAPYISDLMGDVKQFVLNHTLTQIFDTLNKEIDLKYSATSADNYVYQDIVGARQRGLNTVAYEANVSIYNNPYDSVVGQKLDMMETDTRMKDLYLHMLNAWKTMGPDVTGKGATLWNQFTDNGWDSASAGQWGHWTARKYMTQPQAQCPRWQALCEFAQANPRWWTDLPLPTSQVIVGRAGVDRSALRLSTSTARPGSAPLLTLTYASAQTPVMTLFALDGRQVAELRVAPPTGAARADGMSTVTWQPRTSQGQAIVAGTYLVSVKAGGRSVCRKITWQR
jgi:hypothetical protein